MRNTGQFVKIDGLFYAVCEHDGQPYLYDPRQELDSPHRGAGLAGFGVSSSANAAWAGANVALNFVPVVGNILSAVSSVAQAIFGGGDQTPIADIWEAVITARTQLAAARNTYAGSVVDTFTVPAGLDPRSDGNAPSGTALAAQITAEVMNLPSGDRHDVKRASEYSAIQAMQSELAQYTAALKDRGIVAEVVHELAPGISPDTAGAGAVPVAQQTQQTPVQVSLLPWLLPVGALILYALS